MKLIFKIYFFVVCIVFFSCKKQFDKNYYKNCIGEDTIETYSTIVDRKILSNFFNNRTFSDKYLHGNCNCELDAVLISDEIFEEFKIDLLKSNPNIFQFEDTKKIKNLDTANQSILITKYCELDDEGESRKKYISNHYAFLYDAFTNTYYINHSVKLPQGSSKYEGFSTWFTCLIVKKVNKNSKIEYNYNEKYCK